MPQPGSHPGTAPRHGNPLGEQVVELLQPIGCVQVYDVTDISVRGQQGHQVVAVLPQNTVFSLADKRNNIAGG